MLSKQEQKQRYWGLILTLGSIIGSFALNLGLELPFLSCPLLRLTGIPCPAWGLTRSFMATARGELHLAFNYHLLGPFLFMGFLIMGVHWGLELLRHQRIEAFYVPIISNLRYQLFFFFLLLGYHSFRLLELMRSGQIELF
ncbi:MAG: DUF2752 domain-containing protein [Microcystaceae cyanobacterium]